MAGHMCVQQKRKLPSSKIINKLMCKMVILFASLIMFSKGTVVNSNTTHEVNAQPQISNSSTNWMTDKHGNKADINGVIIYAPVNLTAVIITASYNDIYPAMLTFDAFARAIAEGGFVFGDYPIEFFPKLSRDGSIVPIPKFFHGYLFGVGAGLFLALALLVASFVFCICMRCGALQPKKEEAYLFISSEHLACEEVKKSLPLVQRVSMSVAILVLLAMVGIVTLGLCNHHLSKALIQLGDNVLLVLDDVVTFANSTEEGLLNIFDKLDFIRTVFFRDLDNLNQLLDRSIREEVEKHRRDTGLDDVIQELKTLERTTHSITRLLQQLRNDLNHFRTFAGYLVNNLNKIKQMCGQSQCNTTFPNIQVPNANISKSLAMLTSLTQTNLSSLLDKLDNFTADLGNFNNHDFVNFTKKLKNLLNEKLTAAKSYRFIITNTKQAVLDLLQLEEMKKKVSEIRSTVLNIDQTRQIILLQALIIGAIPLIALLAGAIFAPMALKKFIKHFQVPLQYRKKRQILFTKIVVTCLAAGSHVFLMSSWIWMLVTTIVFTVGAPVEGVICSPLCDPDLKVVDKLAFAVLGEGLATSGAENETSTWLARLIGMPATNITIASVMHACRERHTLYSAFRVSRNPATNLTRILDFRKQLNITEFIPGINVTIPPFDILTPGIIAYLNDLDQALEDIPLKQLEAIAQNKIADSVRYPLLPLWMYRMLGPGVVIELDSSQKNVSRKLRQLKQFLRPNNQPLREKINTTLDAVRQSQREFPVALQQAVVSGTKSVAKRLTDILDSLVQEVRKNVEEEVGNCRPVYDMVKVLVLDGVCSNINDAINGLWLSIGWLLLFGLTAVVLCMWLYKHIFKTMLDSPPSTKAEDSETKFTSIQESSSGSEQHVQSNQDSGSEKHMQSKPDQFYHSEGGRTVEHKGQPSLEGSDLFAYAQIRTQEILRSLPDKGQQKQDRVAQPYQPEGSDLDEYAQARMQEKHASSGKNIRDS